MLRARLILIAAPFLLFGVMAGYPCLLLYTEFAGDRAVAHIDGCDSYRRRLSCHGTWQGPAGRGSGHVSGVDSKDVGHDLPVRIGPLGADAKGFDSSSLIFLFPAVAALIMLPIMFRRIRGPAKAAAADLLAAPPAGSDVVLVDGDGVRDRDGTLQLTFDRAGEPPGYRPLLLPGRVRRRPTGAPLELMRQERANVQTSERFTIATVPGGGPAWLLDRCPTGDDEPETILLDPGGLPRGLVRRDRHHPARLTLLTSAGHTIGRIAKDEGVRFGVYVVRNEHGRPIGRLVLQKATVVMALETQTPAPLRDLVIAAAADLLRLTS